MLGESEFFYRLIYFGRLINLFLINILHEFIYIYIKNAEMLVPLSEFTCYSNFSLLYLFDSGICYLM